MSDVRRTSEEATAMLVQARDEREWDQDGNGDGRGAGDIQIVPDS